MKKMLNYITSNAWRLCYVFCNRIVMSYAVFVFLLWLCGNVKNMHISWGYYLLGFSVVAIILWSTYLVCTLPHIKPNRWEKPMITWVKQMLENS